MLGHNDRAVHEFALRELAAADYTTLQSVAPSVDAERLMARMDVLSDRPLKPVRILLLGFTEDEQSQALLESGVANAVETGGATLGAYATALIERAGFRAVLQLIAGPLADPALPRDRREIIVEALTIHSVGADRTLSIEIAEALHAAVEVDPSLAPTVARQFGPPSNFALAEAVRKAIDKGASRSLMDQIVVERCLGMAKVHNGSQRAI